MEGSNPATQTIKAHAKINLALSVTGRRTDGYHELSMLNARIALCDEIIVTLTRLQSASKQHESTHKKIDFSLTTSLNASYINPQSFNHSSDNIITKAIKEFSTCFFNQIKDYFHLDIHLKKNIPVGGGLGGGSSDAASVLTFLYNNIIDFKDSSKLAYHDPSFSKLALSIGADLPFFLHNTPLAQVTGIGEKIVPTSSENLKLGTPVFLLVPNFSISTKKVFETLRHQREHTFSSSKVELFHNDLAYPAALVEPRIELLIKSLQKISDRSGLSGSGSTLYCLTPSQEEQNKLLTLSKNENLTIIETNIA